MKRLILLVCLLLVSAVVQASSEYRDFMDTQGRTIRGRILAVDGKAGVVTIERDTRRTAKVPISVFSEMNQTYIHKWKNQEGVRSPSKLKIECNRRNVKSWNEKQMGPIFYSDGSKEENQVVGKIDFDEIGYEILLANRNNYAIAGLLLEYCIYYEQEVTAGNKAKQGVLFGSVNMNRLEPHERKKIKTNTVVVFKNETNASFVNSRVLNGKVSGIALRLYVQDDNEKTLIRGETFPDNLASSHQWSTQSNPVGGYKKPRP